MAKMPCLVMAGGQGRRLKAKTPKPFIKVCGKPMISHVVETLAHICNHIVIALSPYTLIDGLGSLCIKDFPNIDYVLTSGASYVEDLTVLLRSLTKPLLVVPADMPLLTPEGLKKFLTIAEGLKEFDIINLATGKGIVGLSLFRGEGGSWTDVQLDSDEFLDVDTPEDLKKALELCRRMA